jgi:hypothetical protein
MATHSRADGSLEMELIVKIAYNAKHYPHQVRLLRTPRKGHRKFDGDSSASQI